MDPSAFRYETAFSRNIGWVTRDEQIALRGKRVAIAGLGGVGGSHLLTLARLGIGAFNISDKDTFEVVNLNRQAGAVNSTLGESKVKVLEWMAHDINPSLQIKSFDRGIDRSNVREFLRGCDLYVDGLDFFAVDARRDVFAACAEMGVPAVTAAPMGMSAALMVFMPGGMTFEQYFRLEGQSRDEQLIHLLVGLAPALIHRHYLADPSAVDMANRRVPSTPMACDLCAGMAATEALKILLNRGPTFAAPRAIQFDAYRQKFVRTWRPGGNANPLNRLTIAFARKQLGKRRADNLSAAQSVPGTA